MNGAGRREYIASVLRLREKPISASAFARQLNVSRQVIVGDVALLRAGGLDIASTPRGYALYTAVAGNPAVFKAACRHGADLTARELYAVVDNGGELMDVIVEHPVYGLLTGRLNIATRRDADAFLKKTGDAGAGLLSELTSGIHLHTIACRDEAAAENIRGALRRTGVLLETVENLN